jgi:FkbM family methyltransferase
MKKPDINFSKCLNKLFFKGQRNGFFVECGANTGEAGSITWWFEKELVWSGLLIEPNPHCFAELVKQRPNCENLNLALSNSQGTASFEFPTDGPRGLFAGRGSVNGACSYGSRPTETHEVAIDTYRNILGSREIEKIDLFILDVEGHEMEALEGAMDCSLLPRVWVIETNKTTAEDVLSLIGPLGYTVAGNDRSNTYFLKE